MSNIKEALAAAEDTKALRIGWDILGEVGELFREQFPERRALVVADVTTFAIAGKHTVSVFEQDGIDQDVPFIYEDSHLYAEYRYVNQLVTVLSATDAIPVVVGSGTLNDLTKRAAFLTGKPYLCVATTASMDGYTAYGASITAQGAKQTFECPAPKACLADIRIIADAPLHLTAAGYADLFAKITAGADWLLAEALGVEKIDQRAWSIVQDSLHDALDNPNGLRNGDQAALAKLVEGLMLSGFAMQWAKSSRPASGAEHQFSHLWNMENHQHESTHVSHGFQVSIGTLAITALYELLLRSPIADLKVDEICLQWPDADTVKQESLALFETTDFPEIGFQETSAKYINREQLAVQLNLLKSHWPALKAKLQQQLVPFEEVKQRLRTIGAPVEPEQIGISRTRLRDTFVRAQYIRRRFTILDVAVRTGYLSTWLDILFGKNGIWEIGAEND